MSLRSLRPPILLVLALVLAGANACGKRERVYPGVGVVEEVRPQERQLIISHDDIEGLMPAMTMNFDVADDDLLTRLEPGDRIRFELLFTGKAYVVRGAELLGTEEVEERARVDALARNLDPAPDFALVDQDGAARSLASLRGRTVLLDFIYTTCPGPCPILTSVDVAVQDRLADQADRVWFVSISLDPGTDTPAALRRYAEERGADTANWSFLTGGEREVADVIGRYGVASTRAEDGELDHMVVRFLIDGEGRIAGRYLGLRVDAETIAADMRRLATRG